ncbi:hypothetical protein JYT58_00040 [bacterium AH-315-G11]|nr:hypothetical protein [bacterium AH-315-G11]
MKKALCMVIIAFLLAACEQTKEAGDEAARELTGSNMIQQGNAMKQQIKGIEQQQHERLKMLDE